MNLALDIYDEDSLIALYEYVHGAMEQPKYHYEVYCDVSNNIPYLIEIREGRDLNSSHTREELTYSFTLKQLEGINGAKQ